MIVLRFSASVGALSLVVERASVAPHIVLEGPSASGKSTLLEIIAGVGPTPQGEVSCLGQRWVMDGREQVAARDRQVGWVPQHALLFPHLSVRDNVLASPRASAERYEEIASLCGLGALSERSVHRLSGGERQRTALARALASAPRLLLLDEALSALDGIAATALARTLRVYCDRHGIMTLAATHHSAELEALCDEQWQMREGKLVP